MIYVILDSLLNDSATFTLANNLGVKIENIIVQDPILKQVNPVDSGGNDIFLTNTGLNAKKFLNEHRKDDYIIQRTCIDFLRQAMNDPDVTIVAYNLHPDLRLFTNPYEEHQYFYTALVRLNFKLIELENFEFGSLIYSEQEILQIQDLLKNFHPAKYVKTPSFIKILDTSDYDGKMVLYDNQSTNIYEKLGYEPLSYEQLLQCEGKTYQEIKELNVL